MSVEVKINGDVIGECYVVRIDPIDGLPKKNELCTYNFFKEQGFVKHIMYPYGDGMALASKMLREYNR